MLPPIENRSSEFSLKVNISSISVIVEVIYRSFCIAMPPRKPAGYPASRTFSPSFITVLSRIGLTKEKVSGSLLLTLVVSFIRRRA